jgi:hypothetical protein
MLSQIPSSEVPCLFNQSESRNSICSSEGAPERKTGPPKAAGVAQDLFDVGLVAWQVRVVRLVGVHVGHVARFRV